MPVMNVFFVGKMNRGRQILNLALANASRNEAMPAKEKVTSWLNMLPKEKNEAAEPDVDLSLVMSCTAIETDDAEQQYDCNTSTSEHLVHVSFSVHSIIFLFIGPNVTKFLYSTVVTI
jgi:hypothetical protein